MITSASKNIEPQICSDSEAEADAMFILTFTFLKKKKSHKRLSNSLILAW